MLQILPEDLSMANFTPEAKRIGETIFARSTKTMSPTPKNPVIATEGKQSQNVKM
jgi:hypothetical protein